MNFGLKCKKPPKNFKGVVCVNRNMGGHSRDIINHYNSSNKRVYCGKSTSRTINEYNFYMDFGDAIRNGKFSKKYIQFLPKVMRQLCERRGIKYFIMENLFSGMNKNNIKFVDIKLGQKTAHKAKGADFIKEIRHSYIDRQMSISNREHFRLEGGGRSPSKSVRMKMEPEDIIDYLFEDTSQRIIDQIIHKLDVLLELLKQNWLRSKTKKNYVWDTIGTSLFIAHDNKKAVVKLIDFNHSEIWSPDEITKDTRDLTYNIYDGLRSFVRLL